VLPRSRRSFNRERRHDTAEPSPSRAVAGLDVDPLGSSSPARIFLSQRRRGALSQQLKELTMSFSNYTNQAPRPGKLVPFPLRGLRNSDGSSPVVHVEFLGETNRPYWLEALAKASAKARGAVQTSNTPTEIDRANRDERQENRQAVIDHSARRIENVFRDDGTPATDKDIAAILRAIPDVDFLQIWNFVHNPNNFRDYGEEQ
jgi:hypothetical protein